MKHLLTVALVGLVALSGQSPVQAKAPKPDAFVPGIHVEMRGILSALWLPRHPVSFHLEVQGTTYHLRFRDANQRHGAEQLEGRNVVVTGELRGQVVMVESLCLEQSGSPLKSTTVKIKGKIAENVDLNHLGQPARILWEITANGRKFDLDLSGNPELLAMARLLRGKTVVVTGTMIESNLERLLHLAKDDAGFHLPPRMPLLGFQPTVIVTGLAIEPGLDEYVETQEALLSW